MKFPYKSYIINFLLATFLIAISACNLFNKDKNISPDEMDAYVATAIRQIITAADSLSRLDKNNDTFFSVAILNKYYAETSYSALWSSTEKWKPCTQQLMNYLGKCENEGLFKEDYQYTLMDSLKRSLDMDSLKRKDPVLWARAEVLMTDAFIHVLQDLKQGRLQDDSLAWKNNPSEYEHYFKPYLSKLSAEENPELLFHSAEPGIKEYVAIKKTIPSFLSSMDRKKYTFLPYPYKDSLGFIKLFINRLQESGVNVSTAHKPDSSQLSRLITGFQQSNKLKITGKVTGALVDYLNDTDQEKFKRIAITLDKLKQIPFPLPKKYIWVNLPSYYLQVWDNDTIALESRVIIGRPATATPNITSEISDLVIYPTWTVPNSIIVKELLPGLKRNPGHLARKGLGLYNYKDQPVDPYTVNWTKYNTGIPYKIRQGSGDNNSLGVMKFNFSNKHSVYLHDTNQRYLFKNNYRSLSHGCVRVQEWQKLAYFIARNDSSRSAKHDSLRLSTDSINNWLSQKIYRKVEIKKKLPLYIGYFTCEAVKGRIKFFDDVYGEDKVLIEKYFALK